MPERNSNSDKYRFGFNGKENDNEVKGTGNSLDFGARIYDSRLGRWFACDPIANKYPELSSYQFCSNNPILYIDPNGKEIVPTTPRAQNALDAILNSFSTKGKKGNVMGGVDLFGLDVPATDKGENYKTMITYDEFLKRAKNYGLKGEKLSQATTVFKALSSEEIYEIQTVQATETTGYKRTDEQAKKDNFLFSTSADNTNWLDFKKTKIQEGDKATKSDIDDLMSKGIQGVDYSYFPKKNTNNIIVINVEKIKSDFVNEAPSDEEQSSYEQNVDKKVQNTIMEALKTVVK